MGGHLHAPWRDAAIERALVAAAEATTVEDLGLRALPHLRHAVGASTALLYRYDDAGRLAPLGGDLAFAIEGYARHHLASDPVHGFPRTLSPRPRVVLATRHVDRRVFRRSDAYGEFYARLEIAHLACVWLTAVPYATPGMTGLLFARPRRSDDFLEEDRTVLGRALPALAAAVARAARLRDLAARNDALEALVAASARDARLVLAGDGRVVWASAACDALLGSGARAALEELRRAAREGYGAAVGKGPARAVALSLRAPGARLVAHLSILRASSGAPLVLVELEDAKPPRDVLRAPGRGGRLTPAEAAVLDVLSRGSSNREIAAELCVSVETVRTHVRRILRKLGARSRVDAALLAARARS